ncbi:hypothetical protein GNY06_11875 [Elizabethkingia argentiflava]|uniref:Porin n=1 Tax=Elizabethkingia argenteiflava TaxID=2681556 RepID=A0A845PYZ5_9FLAO|nr:putative porin [Elizabethkingia argenteiflava]NAW52036.1 hypothetical protein [Elizabethkingia argenteiflava]
MRYIFLWLIWLSGTISAQVINKTDNNRITGDSVIIDNGRKDSIKIFKPSIQDYKFRTEGGADKIFDIALTPDKTFIFSQFNNKDNFGKVQFPNSGQPFNPLMFELMPQQNLAVLPTGKAFNMLRVADIRYYDVKTPTTTFIYHNAPGNGSVLSSSYTQNVGKNFNFSINYMGLRAKGLYQRNLSVNNNFNFSSHYQNQSGRYEFFTHYLNQNVNNEENGGIKLLDQFLGGDSRFENRQNVEINLSSSESFFNYRRYYWSHSYGLFKIDGAYPLKLKHTFINEGNKYYYVQNGSENFYNPYAPEVIKDFTPSSKKYSKKFTNIIGLVFNKPAFKLDAGLKYQKITLGTNGILLQNEVSPLEWKENRLGIEGNLQIKLWNKFNLDSHAEYTTGNKFGNFIQINNDIRFATKENFAVEGKLNFQSAAPSFNFLLNGSIYKNFNYAPDFKHQSILEAGGLIKLKWLDASGFINYFNINNNTYLNAQRKVEQLSSSINITQIGGGATLSYKKFHLHGKVLFQSAINNKEVFPMPHFIGRANLYFQSHAFKDAAEIQTGIKAYYFDKFRSREFFPVLNEFALAGNSSHAIGGYPIMEMYFNMKVKSMMLFIEGQHINTAIGHNKSFAAPYYPVADFRLNLGIVWYIFS